MPHNAADTPSRPADTSPYLGANSLLGESAITPPGTATAANPSKRVASNRSSNRPKSTPFPGGINRNRSTEGQYPPRSMPATASETGAHGTNDPLLEKPDAVWFVRTTSGGQYGPATSDVMRSWIVEGRVGYQMLVWRSDWADWLPAERVFKFMSEAPKDGSSASKAARYMEKRKFRRRFRPLHYVLFGVGLLALILLSAIIIF